MNTENRFEKYILYKRENGNIVDVNQKAFELAEDAFLLFKTLYDTAYGNIYEDGNLISIHTGGWSENESLIEEFKETGWWFKHHKITQSGGHYFFDTDFYSDKKWEVKAVTN